MTQRKPYPTDVSDEEWGLVAPYLTLLSEDAGQRRYTLREVFNALRWIVRAGAPWRMLPNDFPPWQAVHQQTLRWIAVDCFEALVHDLREILRVAAGKKKYPSAAVMDSRTLRSNPQSGHRAGYDGTKKRGSKLHIAVDTLGNLLAAHVTPANEQDRAQVGKLAAEVQEATGDKVKIAFADQGYTGDMPATQAAENGIELLAIKLAEAKRDFVLMPRRWVVERSFGWLARFRRLARDYERLPQVVTGLHFIAFACLLLNKSMILFSSSS